MRNRRRKIVALRLSLMAVGLFVILSTLVIWPQLFPGRMENAPGAREKLGPLHPGDVAEQAVDVPFYRVDEISVRPETNKSSKGMSLTIGLYRGRQLVAEQVFPLTKVKSKSHLKLALPDGTGGGTYVLRLAASGEGTVSLSGETGAAGFRLNGNPQEANCYVRAECRRRVINWQLVLMGGVLVLIGLVPSGERWKEDEHHAA